MITKLKFLPIHWDKQQTSKILTYTQIYSFDERKQYEFDLINNTVTYRLIDSGDSTIAGSEVTGIFMPLNLKENSVSVILYNAPDPVDNAATGTLSNGATIATYADIAALLTVNGYTPTVSDIELESISENGLTLDAGAEDIKLVTNSIGSYSIDLRVTLASDSDVKLLFTYNFGVTA